MARIIGFVLRFVVKLTPWILKLVGNVLVIVLTTLQALFRGVLPQAEKMATYWTQEVIRNGDLPNIWAKQIYPVMYLFALLTMIVGWIITAYLTVWLVSLIF